MALKDLLKSTLSLEQDDVFHVDVMDSFAFFNTPNQHREKVLETFADFELNGRSINVEVSEKGPRGSGGGGGNGKRFGGGGGDRRSERRGDRKKFSNNGGGSEYKKKRRSSDGSKPSGFGRRPRR